MFKEIKNNQLTINIPEGMKILVILKGLTNK